MNDIVRAANSGSTSLRSPEPVPVSALPGNDPGRKDIRSKADRRWRPSRIPEGNDAEATAEAFARDWTRNCEVCAETPVVNVTGLCGPCTFGESETYGGNW